MPLTVPAYTVQGACRTLYISECEQASCKLQPPMRFQKLLSVNEVTMVADEFVVVHSGLLKLGKEKAWYTLLAHAC